MPNIARKIFLSAPISLKTSGFAICWLAFFGLLVGLGGLGGVGCGPKVECRKASDCEKPAKYCALGLCKECYTDADCARSDVGPYCDPKSFLCVLQVSDGGADGGPDTPSETCTPGDAEECYTGDPTTRGKGVCKQGKRTCLSNGTWGPCAGEVTPKEETCDSQDNDCDGEVDEDLRCECKLGATRECYTGASGTAGKGECKAGTQRCLLTTWGPCNDQVRPKTEVCDDKKDNDCDGKIDESCGACTPGQREACYDGDEGTQGKGECKQGTRTCNTARAWGSCTGQVVPKAEVCDSKDNNCDGKIDNAAACQCTTVGAIRSCTDTSNSRCTKGVQTCSAEKIWGKCVTGTRATTELCDNKDNDCDGKIDDSPSGAPACPQQNGACKGSKARCEGGKWQACDAQDYATNAAYEATETKCDNVDNDCDGLVDEDVKGCVTLVAGSGSRSYRDGKAEVAAFNYPEGLAVDANGHILVADSRNNTIRTIDLSKGADVTGLVGDIAAGFTDGTVAAARFSRPVAVLPANIAAFKMIFIADQLNHRIRALDLQQNTVDTVAGLKGKTPAAGYLDGKSDEAKFNGPQGLAFNGTKLYVADSGNHAIREVDLIAGVTTIAGNCTTSCTKGYKDGPATSALFSSPTGLAYNAKDKRLYIADSGNHCIRTYDFTTKEVATFAGVCGKSGFLNGPNASALFNYPREIVFDAAGTAYVADRSNYRVRKITGGAVSTFAGSGSSGYANGPLTTARFTNPTGLAIDKQGHLYVSSYSGNRIQKITMP